MNALQAFVKLDVLKGKIEALTRAMEKLELDNNSSNVNVQTKKDCKLLLEMRSELEKEFNYLRERLENTTISYISHNKDDRKLNS